MMPTEIPIFMYHGHDDNVFAVAWSPDSASIASGSRDKTIHIWNALTGKVQLHLSGIMLHTCSQSPGHPMGNTLPVVIPEELYRYGRPTQVETLSLIMATRDLCVASPGLQIAHTSHPVETLGIARCRYGLHLAAISCILTSSNIEYLAFPGRLMVNVLPLAALMDSVQTWDAMTGIDVVRYRDLSSPIYATSLVSKWRLYRLWW